MGKTTSIIEILEHVAALQSSGTSTCPQGVFPSVRSIPKLGLTRKDDTIFFTACIVDILQSVETHLSPEERAISDHIIKNAIAAYPLYSNKDGLDTYNFWRTRPSGHFPYGWFTHRFEHFRIPDDIDDTALVFLTEGASRERVETLREKLKGHANLAYRQARNTFEEYRGLKVYSTFIGKQMYIDIDVCVLSNLMRLILPHFGNELNTHDRDSLHVICDVIRKGRHVSDPFRSAPQYGTTALILYHVARLLPLLPKEYDDVASIVTKDLHDLNRKLSLSTEKLMVELTLLRLGEQPGSPGDYSIETCKNSRMSYFLAGMFTAYEGALAQRISRSSLVQFQFFCEAFNCALLLHYEVMKRRVGA